MRSRASIWASQPVFFYREDYRRRWLDSVGAVPHTTQDYVGFALCDNHRLDEGRPMGERNYGTGQERPFSTDARSRDPETKLRAIYLRIFRAVSNLSANFTMDMLSTSQIATRSRKSSRRSPVSYLLTNACLAPIAFAI